MNETMTIKTKMRRLENRVKELEQKIQLLEDVIIEKEKNITPKQQFENFTV